MDAPMELLVYSIGSLPPLLDLLEAHERILSHVEPAQAMRAIGLAALACKLLLRLWQHPACTDYIRDRSFGVVLRIFELRHELFGLQIEHEKICTGNEAWLLPDVIALVEHAQETDDFPPDIYRLLARACPLYALTSLMQSSEQPSSFLRWVLYEAGRELRCLLDIVDWMVDTRSEDPTQLRRVRSVLIGLRPHSACLPQKIVGNSTFWEAKPLTPEKQGPLRHSYLLIGLLFGWSRLADVFRDLSARRCWPAPASQAVQGLILLDPTPRKIVRLLRYLPTTLDDDWTADAYYTSADLRAWASALGACGRAVATYPMLVDSAELVCRKLTHLGDHLRSRHLKHGAPPIDPMLSVIVSRELAGILRLQSRLIPAQSTLLRAYVEQTETWLTEDPAVRAWTAMDGVRNVLPDLQ
jgi:hypothetical protein